MGASEAQKAHVDAQPRGSAAGRKRQLPQLGILHRYHTTKVLAVDCFLSHPPPRTATDAQLLQLCKGLPGEQLWDATSITATTVLHVWSTVRGGGTAMFQYGAPGELKAAEARYHCTVTLTFHSYACAQLAASQGRVGGGIV